MNQSKTSIDWEYWQSVSSLTFQEIACLLADIEPFEWDMQSELEDPKLKKAYRLVLRAVEDEKLSHPCEVRIAQEKLLAWYPWKNKLEELGINTCN